MSLPILKIADQPSREALIRYFHQTERHWTQHMAEETPLDEGQAFANAELSDVWDANRMLDASLPEGTTPAGVIERVEHHYASLASRCYQWVMNPSAPPQRSEPLVAELLARRYTIRSSDLLYMNRMPSTPIVEAGGLKIIPARASFRHARQLAEEAALRWNAPKLADAAMMHLEDPHFDAALALKDGEAVATAGVLAVGEIGRIESVFVSETSRRLGLGRTMMSRALEVCARSLF